MRRGELLSLSWSDLHLERLVAHLKTTKNGSPRPVPPSRRAVAVLRAMDPSVSGRVFPLEPAALHKAFQRLCPRAGITDLRFHDLRHTATTRLAERLPNVIELAAVTGHRSLQMLRYSHPQYWLVHRTLWHVFKVGQECFQHLLSRHTLTAALGSLTACC